jgi:hypothetical protein
LGGDGSRVGGFTTAGRRRRGLGSSVMGVSFAAYQSGIEASLRKPVRSGRRSISEAITAGSILSCSLLVVEAIHSVGLRDLECVV